MNRESSANICTPSRKFLHGYAICRLRRRIGSPSSLYIRGSFLPSAFASLLTPVRTEEIAQSAGRHRVYIYHAQRRAECTVHWTGRPTDRGNRLLQFRRDLGSVFGLRTNSPPQAIYTTESRFRIEDLTYIEDFDYYSLHLSRCLAMF